MNSIKVGKSITICPRPFESRKFEAELSRDVMEGVDLKVESERLFQICTDIIEVQRKAAETPDGFCHACGR